MLGIKRVKIRSDEFGLCFRDREFQGVLGTGTHWLLDLLGTLKVDVVSRRDPWIVHDKLDLIVKSGALIGKAEVIDLQDHQRALVWIDGRFSQILSPGLCPPPSCVRLPQRVTLRGVAGGEIEGAVNFRLWPNEGESFNQLRSCCGAVGLSKVSDMILRVHHARLYHFKNNPAIIVAS